MDPYQRRRIYNLQSDAAMEEFFENADKLKRLVQDGHISLSTFQTLLRIQTERCKDSINEWSDWYKANIGAPVFGGVYASVAILNFVCIVMLTLASFPYWWVCAAIIFVAYMIFGISYIEESVGNYTKDEEYEPLVK